MLNKQPFVPLPEDYVPPPTAPWAPGQPFGPGGTYRSPDKDRPPRPTKPSERDVDLDKRRMVYFLQRITDGAIKIGTSVRPLARVYAMRAEQGCHVGLLATMPGGTRQEQLMHGRFARSRIDGEWFKPSRSLLAFISKLNAAEAEEARAEYIKAGGKLPPRDRP